MIFFIRKKKEPDTPYFTLELDIKTLTVNQNRGNCNCARTKQVEEFESAWLEHIQKLNKSKKTEVKIA